MQLHTVVRLLKRQRQCEQGALVMDSQTRLSVRNALQRQHQSSMLFAESRNVIHLYYVTDGSSMSM